MKAYRGYGAAKRDSINDLDCAECGGWFPSFTALADHVVKVHTKKTQPLSKVESYYVTDSPAEAKDDMRLPSTPRAAASRKQAKARPMNGRIPGAAASASNDYNPFLKSHHIGGLGATAKLTLTGNVRVSDGMYGEQILAEAKIGRDVYDWAIKLNSPNHRELEDSLGLNTAKWKNKLVAVEVKEHMGRDYIAISKSRAPRATATKRKMKTKSARKVAR